MYVIDIIELWNTGIQWSIFYTDLDESVLWTGFILGGSKWDAIEDSLHVTGCDGTTGQ